MQEIQILTQQAVNAFKESNWQKAISFNQKIIAIDAQNLGALNRLGIAFLKNGNTTKSKNSFKKVLEIDLYNKIALKNISILKTLAQDDLNQQSRDYFVEESTEAKIISLHRLAGKDVLRKLKIGQNLNLKIKNRFINLENKDNIYLGALPEDISARLKKLIEDGNQYSFSVYSISENECRIYVKENLKSGKNSNILSFPILKRDKNNKEIDETEFLESAVNYNLDEENSVKLEIEQNYD
jgi:tetratricopeptide (TPR) repeat protein